MVGICPCIGRCGPAGHSFDSDIKDQRAEKEQSQYTLEGQGIR